MIALLAIVALVIGGSAVVRRAYRQRRQTPPRDPITSSMQQKMARTLTVLVTSGGRRQLAEARKQIKLYRLTRRHFEALAVPPEEDRARNLLVREC